MVQVNFSPLGCSFLWAKGEMTGQYNLTVATKNNPHHLSSSHHVPGHYEALCIYYLFSFTQQTGKQDIFITRIHRNQDSESSRNLPSRTASERQGLPLQPVLYEATKKKAQRGRDHAHPVSTHNLGSMCAGSLVRVQRGGQIPTCHPKLERPEKASWRSHPIHAQGCQS